MLLHTFGTSSGSQPIAGSHHTCLAIETGDNLYFLDAGECGAYNAHLKGVNLLKTRAVFITHPHMDHVGGLGNLLWYIRKVSIVKKISLAGRVIDIFTPCKETVDGFMQILKNTEGDFSCEHDHVVHVIEDGLVFQNDEINVRAVHTNHMPVKDDRFMSFGYEIECEGKKIVFTGDMRIEDLERLVPDDCDVLLVETGHHTITKICDYLKSINKKPEKLVFVHHNGAILRNFNHAKEELKNNWDGDAVLSEEGGTYII